MDLEMDMSYLPRILDQTLHNYTYEYGLSSWKIYGGKSNNATVVIRFGDTSQGQHNTRVNMQYSKKTPAAVRRDTWRLEEHKAKSAKQTISSPIQSHISTINMDNVAEFKPGASMHGCTSTRPRIDYMNTPPMPSLTQLDEKVEQCSTSVDVCCMTDDVLLLSAEDNLLKDAQQDMGHMQSNGSKSDKTQQKFSPMPLQVDGQHDNKNMTESFLSQTSAIANAFEYINENSPLERVCNTNGQSNNADYVGINNLCSEDYSDKGPKVDDTTDVTEKVDQQVDTTHEMDDTDDNSETNTGDSDDEKNSNDDVNLCDGCGIVLRERFDEWFTCTECPFDQFCEICPSCFANGHHDIHKDYMSKYKDAPASCKEFCDACGTIFRHPDQLIYRCSECMEQFNSFYDICKKCYTKTFHKKHRDKMIRYRLCDLI